MVAFLPLVSRSTAKQTWLRFSYDHRCVATRHARMAACGTAPRATAPSGVSPEGAVWSYVRLCFARSSIAASMKCASTTAISLCGRHARRAVIHLQAFGMPAHAAGRRSHQLPGASAMRDSPSSTWLSIRTDLSVSQIAFLNDGDVVESDAVRQGELPLPEDGQSSAGATVAIA